MMHTSDSGCPSFKSRCIQDMFLRIKADYEGRRVTLLGIGDSGYLMAQEIRNCGLAARTAPVRLRRFRSPDGPEVEADQRAIQIFLAANRGRDVLVLDWKAVTGQRLRALLDLLDGGGLESLKTAVVFDVRECRRYPVSLDYVAGVVGIADMN
jgi:hypoxanthine-guanine phosphoribosyltransferase